MLGWLIGDALDMAPVDRAVAHTAGLKARRVATDLPKDQAAKRKDAGKAASRLAAGDPKRLQTAASKADALRDGACSVDSQRALATPSRRPLTIALQQPVHNSDEVNGTCSDRHSQR